MINTYLIGADTGRLIRLGVQEFCFYCGSILADNGGVSNCGALGYRVGCCDIYDEWQYFEFEIDLAANKIAIRRNNMYLFTAGGQTQITLPTPMTGVGNVTLYGSYWNGVLYDDFYVVNNSGSLTNTWLGSTVRCLSTNIIGCGGTRLFEWSGNGYCTGVDLASDDYDLSYISTTDINKTVAVGLETSGGGIFSGLTNPKIGAVRVFTDSTARKTGPLDAAYQHIYRTAAGQIVPLTSKRLVTSINWVKNTEAPLLFTQIGRAHV